MRILLLMIIIGALLPKSAVAFCEEPACKLCNVLFSNDLVVHAKVIKSEILKDNDDPEGIAGWKYYLDIIKVYRGTTKSTLIVCSDNGSGSRLLLTIGKEYILFASKDDDGSYWAGNYCGEVQGPDGEPYSLILDKRIEELLNRKSSIIEGEVRDKNGNLTPGATITIDGNGIHIDVAVDNNGQFSVNVEPGTYKVIIPKSLHLTIGSAVYDGVTKYEIRPITLVGGQCAQISLQEEK